MSNGAIKYVGKGKKFQYLRIYNLEKIWSRIHQVFGPEFTWSRIYLVPNSPLGPEFTWSRIHLVPNSPDTGVDLVEGVNLPASRLQWLNHE